MSNKNYYVYIITNKLNTVFYTGITNNLERRMYEHINKLIKGFTEKYNINKLIYFELFTNAVEAIEREKQIKKYRQEKKLALIIKNNPLLEDLLKK